MKSFTLAATILPLLASAGPLAKRAGGPIGSPIPSDCTVINPLPHASCGVANINGQQPNPSFVSANLLYSSYFQDNLSPVHQAAQCAEQCYGYGNPGECVSSFVAYKVPVPAGYYGSQGGQLETACLLFSDYLTPNDFVDAPQGQYHRETAANIYCPPMLQ